MKKDKILIIGACSRIGTELTFALRSVHGTEKVIAADGDAHVSGLMNYIQLNALDKGKIKEVVKAHGVSKIYLLAYTEPPNGVHDANTTWQSSMQSLLAVLEVARDLRLDKVFWPGSIAMFGSGATKYSCGQLDPCEPATVYGISKKTGEYWCNHYFEEHGVDVRSLRYPGLISCNSIAGNCITAYATNIYHKAIRDGYYTCYLEEDCCLPMMYMPDAIRATLELMNAPKKDISIHTAYNISAMSFAPCDIAAEIQKYLPDFKLICEPDARQAVALSWPVSIDDSQARRDWGWTPGYSLTTMTFEILTVLAKQQGFQLQSCVAPLQPEFFPHEH